MKRLLIILILLMLPVSGWGATYYASPTGSGTTCSEGSPCTFEYAVETKGQNGDTIIVNNGTHGPFGQLVVYNQLTILPATGATPVISMNASQHGFYFHGTNSRNVTGLTLTGAGGASKRAIFFDGGTNVTLNDITVDGWTNGPCLYARNAASGTLNRVSFKDCQSEGTEATLQIAEATLNFNFPVFLNCGNATSGNLGILTVDHANAVVTVNNPIIAGCDCGSAGGPNFIAISAGVLTINNPMMIGNMPSTKTLEPLFTRTGGTFTINNPLYHTGMWRQQTPSSGTVTINNGLLNVSPKLVATANTGMITFFFVDSNHTHDGTGPGGEGTSAQHYGDVFNSLGVSVSYFPDDQDQLTEAQWGILSELISEGHDVGCQGPASSPLTVLNPFYVSYSGAGANPRVVVSYTDDNNATLQCVTDSGTDLSIDTGQDDTYAYIGTATQANSVVKAINDLADWTATNPNPNYFDDGWSCWIDADTYSVSGNTDILLNQTRFFGDEISGVKTLMETELSDYTVRSYMCPIYLVNSAARDAIKAAGYDVALGGTGYGVSLSSISNIYGVENAMADLWAYAISGGTQSEVEGGARALAEGLKYNRLWVALLLPENAGATEDQITWFVNALKKEGVLIKSFAEAHDYLASDYTASGDGYTKTFPSVYSYTLQAGSPCINAGTNPFSDGDGDQYDYAGNLVWRDSDDKAVGAWSDGVEIGAYGWFGGVLLQ